jgi:hypothetical protein
LAVQPGRGKSAAERIDEVADLGEFSFLHLDDPLRTRDSRRVRICLLRGQYRVVVGQLGLDFCSKFIEYSLVVHGLPEVRMRSSAGLISRVGVRTVQPPAVVPKLGEVNDAPAA